MPVTLTDAIVATVKETDGQDPSEHSGARTNSAAALAADARIDMEAVSWATLQRLVAQPEMLAMLKDAIKDEN